MGAYMNAISIFVNKDYLHDYTTLKIEKIHQFCFSNFSQWFRGFLELALDLI